jgi:RNA polymerase sigma factor (sigma-70 family)
MADPLIGVTGRCAIAVAAEGARRGRNPGAAWMPVTKCRAGRIEQLMVREISDEELLTDALRGMVASFEEFYRRWSPAVMSYHRRATGSSELALDLTAETFAAAIASLDRFDQSRGSGSIWLFSIARHKLHDSYRVARVEASARQALGWTRVEFDDEDLERVEEIASHGHRDLDQFLDQLPEDQRTALLERVLGERDYAEIAAEMACSEMLVRQRVHRALRRLRRMMEEPA